MYISWLVMGAILAEFAALETRDITWNTINAGRTWETTDWSKFRESVVEEEDEDEEEEDEEGGDDDEEEEE
jgi:hypothetical protein